MMRRVIVPLRMLRRRWVYAAGRMREGFKARLGYSIWSARDPNVDMRLVSATAGALLGLGAAAQLVPRQSTAYLSSL